MKRMSGVFLGISLIFCTGCTSSGSPIIVDSETNCSMEATMRAEDFFLSTLEYDGADGYVYPDTYGGMYADGDRLIFLVAAEDFSEYQYLHDMYSYVDFRQVEYSWNYLKKLADEYMATYDKSSETVYMARVDVRQNRVVIKVDKETLSHKSPNENSPLVFELGTPLTNL